MVGSKELGRKAELFVAFFAVLIALFPHNASACLITGLETKFDAAEKASFYTLYVITVGIFFIVKFICFRKFTATALSPRECATAFGQANVIFYPPILIASQVANFRGLSQIAFLCFMTILSVVGENFFYNRRLKLGLLDPKFRLYIAASTLAGLAGGGAFWFFTIKLPHSSAIRSPHPCQGAQTPDLGTLVIVVLATIGGSIIYKAIAKTKLRPSLKLVAVVAGACLIPMIILAAIFLILILYAHIAHI